MSLDTVCQWLGYYLCLRNTPKTDTIHPDSTVFDAVIVWKGSPLLQLMLSENCLLQTPSSLMNVA